ncbi:AAA family ATPase [Variovorax ginsengisoli]|uniref:Pilus assembly protein CpaE n=1 Tax=Variovorax ginsengisoli TaxID=363844 RepID=A0ABT9SED0_9BURK|nr:histidine kinase [Variovorax ginsengisoli]MDP9902712.1 pilus assembly protein CpaE [Variovorax ginsengisoli]
MNMPRNRALGYGADTYLFASNSGSNVTWLLSALQRSGTVVPSMLNADVLNERIAAIGPQALFLDFSGDQSAAAAEVHRQVKRDWPALPILGTGPASQPTAVLTALRAGVNDFVDITAAPEDVVATLAAMLERGTQEQATRHGRTIALLGARAGMGVTTLATHLAVLLQEMLKPAEAAASTPAAGMPVSPARGIALLDLGLPARDGLLYLDTASDFNFVDGARNLRRLDQTLVQTALAHHNSGAVVLPLPASLAQVREISHADSMALVKRLADFFDFQIADLGGFSLTEFVAQTVLEADKTWVVCDLSIGGIVSTANLLRDLRGHGVDPARLALVVNKMDKHVGLPASDIATRLGLPLAHVLPMRSAPLLAAASRGEMLASTSRSDPYVQAVLGMARSLLRDYADGSNWPAPSESPWRARIARLTGKWKRATGARQG